MMIDKDAAIQIVKSRYCSGCACDAEYCIDALRDMPTEPKVNRAEILRLCNDIEDCISEAWALFKIEHCDYNLIHDKLQAIGKELNGDAGTDR